MPDDDTSASDAPTSTDGPPPTAGVSAEAARYIEDLAAANAALRDRVAALEAAGTAALEPELGGEPATQTDAADAASTQTDIAPPETGDETAMPSDTEPASTAGSDPGTESATGSSERGDRGLSISRRGVVATLASLGLLGAASQSASAHHSGHDHLGETWSGDPGNHGLKFDLGSGTDVAVFGRSESTSARALKGFATATSGQTIGVEGKAESPDSIALLGNATATAGTAKGLEGRSAAKFGTGVIGFAKHATGTTKGVRGLAQSPNGRGIEATNTASSGDAFGLTAETQSSSGTAIRGDATSGSGTTYGVRGTAASPNGYGLHTPDDAKIDGTTELTTIDTTESDFSVKTGTTTTDRAKNVVHGHASNEVTDDAEGATIGGGGRDDGSTVLPNRVHDDWGTVAGGVGNEAGSPDGDPISASAATVGGGLKNTASGSKATVGGGIENTASGGNATVGGGRDNEASGGAATVCGGELNVASANWATVGGGLDNLASGKLAVVGGGDVNDATAENATVCGGHANTASGFAATVPGGADNTADGAYSLAAGRLADTNGHDGAFVFGDSSTTAITAQNPDEVRSQMPMYAPSFNTTSARAAKTDVAPVDPQTVLDGVESLAIRTWTFANQDDGRHMGPMAEDFHETFELGGDEETIATVDADGVAFAAIQRLSEELAEKADRIAALQAETESKAQTITDLEERLATLEAAVGPSQEAPAGD